MLSGADAFNQPIGNWDVSSVSSMNGMFFRNTAFNQPIGNWDVSNVLEMEGMFREATAFNQPIGNWDVSNVTDMGGDGSSDFGGMFLGATVFNQNIGSWNVSSVTDMQYMFFQATAFNQPIGNWNVVSVTNMSGMFINAGAFNQPIGNWNVGSAISMQSMFYDASAFNQPIGSWDVSNVTNMTDMFTGAQLSTANYDATLIGWATIEPNENPLQPNVTFSGGNSNYCNGETARASIISTYGWTITDAGLNCELSTETFDTTVLKLYPNPVLSSLNVQVDFNLINQPYSIIDGLGRVVLNGNLNEVDTAINVEQLSKGVYYLKLSDSNASKFIKD
jgi:surface protein